MAVLGEQTIRSQILNDIDNTLLEIKNHLL